MQLFEWLNINYTIVGVTGFVKYGILLGIIVAVINAILKVNAAWFERYATEQDKYFIFRCEKVLKLVESFGRIVFVALFLFEPISLLLNKLTIARTTGNIDGLFNTACVPLLIALVYIFLFSVLFRVFMKYLMESIRYIYYWKKYHYRKAERQAEQDAIPVKYEPVQEAPSQEASRPPVVLNGREVRVPDKKQNTAPSDNNGDKSYDFSSDINSDWNNS